MRSIIVLATALSILGGGLVGCASTGPTRTAVGVAIEIDTFHDVLSPWGTWISVSPWGWVWTPTDVPAGWRPYTVGRWVYTVHGWTWLSGWPWGWATFHYGRWTWHEHHGWMWIPGRTWGPGWVAWRTGPGWIGWAPLPPAARWRIGVGLDLGHLDLGVALGADTWTFVAETRFLDADLRPSFARPAEVAGLLGRTAVRVGYRADGPGVIERGLEVARVERVLGHPVDRRRIRDLDRVRDPRGPLDGDEVRLYRPGVRGSKPGAPSRRGGGRHG